MGTEAATSACELLLAKASSTRSSLTAGPERSPAASSHQQPASLLKSSIPRPAGTSTTASTEGHRLVTLDHVARPDEKQQSSPEIPGPARRHGSCDDRRIATAQRNRLFTASKASPTVTTTSCRTSIPFLEKTVSCVCLHSSPMLCSTRILGCAQTARQAEHRPRPRISPA